MSAQAWLTNRSERVAGSVIVRPTAAWVNASAQTRTSSESCERSVASAVPVPDAGSCKIAMLRVSPPIASERICTSSGISVPSSRVVSSRDTVMGEA